VELERVLLDENHDYGIIVAGEQDDSGEMPFDARDLVVRDTQPVSQAQGGLGIALGAGARLELRRAVLVGNHEHAIVAGSQGTATPAEVTLEDVVIAESHSVPAGDRGRGITASGGAQLTGTRVRVIRTHECAVAAIGWGGAPETRVSLSHLLVEDVLPATCAERPHEDPLSCAQPDGSHWGGGNGVAATGGARVTLEDFRIGGCRQAGLLVAKAARVTARRGVITDNELGINALVPGLEGSRLDEDVYTYGNRQDVASVDVPLPAASELIRH